MVFLEDQHISQMNGKPITCVVEIVVGEEVWNKSRQGLTVQGKDGFSERPNQCQYSEFHGKNEIRWAYKFLPSGKWWPF